MEYILEIETKKEKFNEPLYLESGRLLEEFEIVYETYGRLNEDKSNVIVICHALILPKPLMNVKHFAKLKKGIVQPNCL